MRREQAEEEDVQSDTGAVVRRLRRRLAVKRIGKWDMQRKDGDRFSASWHRVGELRVFVAAEKRK